MWVIEYVVPDIILVISSVSENWITVNSFKFMIEISNFIRFFKNLQTFEIFLKIYIFVLRRGLQTALNLSFKRTQNFRLPVLWTAHREGRRAPRFTVHHLSHLPLSINFNSTNKKLNKSGIMSSVVFYERSVAKKAESDILWKRCLH